MKLVPILVILVVLCGFLALEGQAKKVKKQNTKVRFGKISSGWQLLLGSENQSKIRSCVSLKSFGGNNVEISCDSSSIVRFLGFWRPSTKRSKANAQRYLLTRFCPVVYNFLYFCVVDNFCQRNTCRDFRFDFSKLSNCKKVNFDKMLSYNNSTWVLNPNS